MLRIHEFKKWKQRAFFVEKSMFIRSVDGMGERVTPMHNLNVIRVTLIVDTGIVYHKLKSNKIDVAWKMHHLIHNATDFFSTAKTAMHVFHTVMLMGFCCAAAFYVKQWLHNKTWRIYIEKNDSFVPYSERELTF